MRSSDGMLERVTLCDRTVVTLERQREGDTTYTLDRGVDSRSAFSNAVRNALMGLRNQDVLPVS